jgi:hypothetical protein
VTSEPCSQEGCDAPGEYRIWQPRWNDRPTSHWCREHLPLQPTGHTCYVLRDGPEGTWRNSFAIGNVIEKEHS